MRSARTRCRSRDGSSDSPAYARNQSNSVTNQRRQNPVTESAPYGQRKFSASRKPNIRANPIAMSA